MRQIEPNTDLAIVTGNLYLPVVRYPGLYYSADDDKDSDEKGQERYCGTFYYVDPESRLLLNLGRTGVFATKLHAFRQLMAQTTRIRLPVGFSVATEESNAETELKKLWKSVAVNRSTSRAGLGLYDSAEMLEYYETVLNDASEFKLFAFEPRRTNHSSLLFPCESLPDTKEYFRPTPGDHDFTDQPLCKLARMCGFDTLVLQREVGERRVVTEVLDTREDSGRAVTNLSKDPNYDYVLRTMQAPYPILQASSTPVPPDELKLEAYEVKKHAIVRITERRGSLYFNVPTGGWTEWWRPQIPSCPTLWYVFRPIVRTMMLMMYSV